MSDGLTYPVLKVLHLDDDPFELERVQNALEHHSHDCHFQVESVLSVDEYRRALSGSSPDVVLLDIHVNSQGVSGIDLAEETRSRSPETVILMCSTADDIGTIAECLSTGADDFISKKSDKGELSLRVFNSYRLARLKAGKDPVASSPSGKRRLKVVGATMERIAKRIPLILDSAISSVFIHGESGTGKEIVADLFGEALGPGKPFVKVNCGAIAPTLLESELFGHVKGAFTGATADKKGLFESVSGGWIFLDEVATLSKSAQVALLRVLENQEVRRVGSPRSIPIQVRVLAATNEDVPAMVASGEFRADLWQRLREAEITLPPLRERRNEIPEFVKHFCETMQGGPYQVSGPVLEVLKSVSWKDGNIRELRNCLRAMTEMHVDRLLTPLAIPERIWDEIGDRSDEGEKSAAPVRVTSAGREANALTVRWETAEMPPFDELVDRLLLEVTKGLAAERGKLSLRGLAQAIGVSRSTLSGRLKALVHKNLVDLSELTRYVGVSEK